MTLGALNIGSTTEVRPRGSRISTSTPSGQVSHCGLMRPSSLTGTMAFLISACAAGNEAAHVHVPPQSPGRTHSQVPLPSISKTLLVRNGSGSRGGQHRLAHRSPGLVRRSDALRIGAPIGTGRSGRTPAPAPGGSRSAARARAGSPGVLRGPHGRGMAPFAGRLSAVAPGQRYAHGHLATSAARGADHLRSDMAGSTGPHRQRAGTLAHGGAC